MPLHEVSITPARHSGDARGSRAFTTALFGCLAASNIAAWSLAWLAFRDRPVLLGSAALASVLGLRHAVDADHIAAIDNVVRKLLQEGRRPLTTGLWFSLGHSTIVMLASLVVAGAVHAMGPRLPAWQAFGGALGTCVSAAFLLAIGSANAAILIGSWRGPRVQSPVGQGAAGQEAAGQGAVGQAGGFDPPASPQTIGPLSRLFRPLFGVIGRSWHMYPLGVLFGLGFDTATEIGVLGIAAVQADRGMSPWLVMIFPLLFASAMALVDTADSVLMTRAYGWAFVQPWRKVSYNLAMTGASMLVAFGIGGLEVLGLIGNRLALTGRFWNTVGGRDGSLDYLGMAIIGVFALAWAAAAAAYRSRRIAPRRLAESSAGVIGRRP